MKSAKGRLSTAPHSSRAYLPGGQCGLPLPVAPRHWLSPGPGASAKAGAAVANAEKASNVTTIFFALLKSVHLPPTTAAYCRERILRRGEQPRQYGNYPPLLRQRAHVKHPTTNAPTTTDAVPETVATGESRSSAWWCTANENGRDRSARRSRARAGSETRDR
jgi:hypothetical protein